MAFFECGKCGGIPGVTWCCTNASNKPNPEEERAKKKEREECIQKVESLACPHAPGSQEHRVWLEAKQAITAALRKSN